MTDTLLDYRCHRGHLVTVSEGDLLSGKATCRPPKKPRLTKAERTQREVDIAEADIDMSVLCLEVARRVLFKGVGPAHLAGQSRQVREIEWGICDALRAAR